MAFRESIARQVLDRWAGLAADLSTNPPLLLAIVAQESGGDQFAARVEPAVNDQSRGLAQVLMGTLRQMQTVTGASPVVPVPVEWGPDDLWNPQINLQVAEAVITRQIAWWSGDLPRAIASYNAGINIRQGDPLTLAMPGYVSSVIAYYQWFLAAWQPPGPPETPPGSPGPPGDLLPPGAGTDGSPTAATLAGGGVLALVLVVAVLGSR